MVEQRENRSRSMVSRATAVPTRLEQVAGTAPAADEHAEDAEHLHTPQNLRSEALHLQRWPRRGYNAGATPCSQGDGIARSVRRRGRRPAARQPGAIGRIARERLAKIAENAVELVPSDRHAAGTELGSRAAHSDRLRRARQLTSTIRGQGSLNSSVAYDCDSSGGLSSDYACTTQLFCNHVTENLFCKGAKNHMTRT